MIKNLRDRVSDLITNDYNNFDLLRWLKEYNYDIEKTVPNLRHHMRFINSYDFSKYSKYYAVMDQYWPPSFLGYNSKENNFVYVEEPGKMNGDAIFGSVPKIFGLFHRFYIMENQIMKSIRKYENDTGRQSSLCVIADMRDLHYDVHTLSMFKGTYVDLISFLFKHYKDFAHKCVVINSPSFLHIIYHILKHIVPKKLVRNVFILGSDWQTEILQHVDASVLSAHLSRLANDVNDGIKTQSTSVVPTESQKLAELTSQADDFTKLTVYAGTCEFVTVEVKELGKTLEWCYYAERDWGFGVFFTEDKNETNTEVMDMVFPQIEYIRGCTVLLEEHKIECKKLGWYKLWFNNSFSYFRKLKIRYRIVVS